MLKGQFHSAFPTSRLPSSEVCWYWGDLSKTMVLGENGTAFGTDGRKAVSFDVGSGTVNWTWEAPGGELELIAATTGNGLVAKIPAENGEERVVRLDPTGQATFDDWTGNSIQYAYGDMWIRQGSAVTVSAPAILWPRSLFAIPNKLGTRAADGVIPLTIYRIGHDSTVSESSARDQAITAVGYWEMGAGIYFEYDGLTVLNVGPCPQEGDTDCSDSVNLRFFPDDSGGGPWLEAYRRFCTKDESGSNIGLYADPPFCTPQGSTVIFTANLANPNGNVMGATASIDGKDLNITAIGRLALELVVAHELGHQLGLIHCGQLPISFSLIAYCGLENLMFTGILAPTYPNGDLTVAQILRARKIASRWRKRP